MKFVSLQFVGVSICILALSYFSISWWVIAVAASSLAALLTWLAAQKVDNFDDVVSPQKDYQQVAKHISRGSSRIAIGGATVSHFLDKLAKTFNHQVDNAQQIAERITRLEQGNDELLEFANLAENKINDSDQQTQQSKVLLEQLQLQQSTLVTQIEYAKDMLSKLTTSAESISSITTTINQLADQTNMLALNAAIEAARAGEQGRGFAVVADEVRDLARKTADATQGIDNVLSEINQSSHDSVESIEKVAEASSVMSGVITQTSSLIQDASVSSSEAAHVMSQVKQSVSSHGETNHGISANVLQLHETTKQLEHDLKDVSAQAISLSNQTEDIFRQLDVFEVEDDQNAQVQRIATQSAKEIGQLFESAIKNNEITQRALFDFNYQPVENTNPQKFTTTFDKFTDLKLPNIQEPILEKQPFIIFAGAVDKNGYFPTHNKKYSKAMTGNYEQDLANSRTKRIFNDYTGARCGKNTEKFLLQTYKRDTGEVMHDLSVPIYVDGKHWGGFRVGYRAVE